MASQGIRDRVAIVGMGCTRFGERWDSSADDLVVDAVTEAVAMTPGLELADVDAYWVGTTASGVSGLTLSRPMKLDYKPVTRVENYCATGSEAFRNACYAVASGAYDIAMAVGVEKLKESGFSGLVSTTVPGDGTAVAITAPASFSFIPGAYTARYGLDRARFREAMTHVAWKNHCNGARNERAQFRSEVSRETIAKSARVAGELGVYDCSGVSDGAACAIVVRAEDAQRHTENPLYVKALSLVAGPGTGNMTDTFDYTSFPEVVRSAEDAYAQAGISDPRHQLALAEVHDCFTPTEIVLMEDLGFSRRGGAVEDVLGGAFDLSGDLPVNPDGGLKSFGHPIGASGLRMLFECWLQLRQQAPAERQVAGVGQGRTLGMTHNLGGRPGACVSFVSIVGAEPSA